MRQKRFTLLLFSVLLALLVLAATSASRWRGPTAGAVAFILAQPGAPSLTGQYLGHVQLEGVYMGVYSDTAATPTAIDLGRIDLALNLTQAGSAIAGYVLLDDSLVFNQVHTVTVQTSVLPGVAAVQAVQEVATGPMLQGTYDNTTLRLGSERFSESLSASQVLPFNERTVPARTVTRQFSLITTEVQAAGARLVGTYRETIWGYAAKPSTVVGKFVLERAQATPLLPPNVTPEPGAELQFLLPFVSRE